MAQFDDTNTESLPVLFKEGLSLYNELDVSNEASNSAPFQTKVRKATKLLEQSTRLVSVADLFSRNEHFDELPTASLQYLLLPALLGHLTLKRTSGERKEIVNVAEIYFKDFLRRCSDYGLTNYDVDTKQSNSNDPDPKSSSQSGQNSDFQRIAISVNVRANKIQRFQQQKQLKMLLNDLKQRNPNDENETLTREYNLNLLKLTVHEAIDELTSIDMEKPILEHMAQLNHQGPPKKGPPAQPLKPIIITRDAVQKAVFGAGYPALPTLTVEEFYQKRVADGIFPDPGKFQQELSLQQAAMSAIDLNSDQKQDEEERSREVAEESDNPDLIENLRRMDEFKDDHRRGWGNRMNRS